MKPKNILLFCLLPSLMLLWHCNNANNNNPTETTPKIDSAQNAINQAITTEPKKNSEPTPPDSTTFDYIIYLHDKNKSPKEELIRKYIYADLPEDNPDEGKYFYVSIRKIYPCMNFYIVVYEFAEEDYGTSKTSNLLATFTKDGEKIDETNLNVFLETEWNNVGVDEEYLEENIYTRVTTETHIAPDYKGGTEVSRTETITEKYKIDDVGKITELK